MTADAAEAFSSVRREKLIGFSLEACCSCEMPILYGPDAAGSPAISIHVSAYCSVRTPRQYGLSDEQIGRGATRFRRDGRRHLQQQVGRAKWRPRSGTVRRFPTKYLI